MEAKPFIDKYGSNTNIHVCGMGMAECGAKSAKLIAKHKPSVIVLAGIAGAYAGSGLAKGETVAVIRENNADMGAFRGNGVFDALSQEYATARHAVTGHSQRDNIYFTHFTYPGTLKKVISNSVNCAATPNKDRRFNGAHIENMEGAAFFAACIEFGVEFAEIRTISNFVGEAPSDWIIGEATERLADDVKHLIDSL